GRLGPAADAREQARLMALLGRDGTLDELNRELARQLRNRTRDESDAALMAHLEATTTDKIAIANPKWRLSVFDRFRPFSPFLCKGETAARPSLWCSGVFRRPAARENRPKPRGTASVSGLILSVIARP